MRKRFLLLLIPLLMVFSIKAYAACPATGSVSVSATSTPRTCGGNGTITATFSPNTEVALQLLKGGTIISQVSPPALSSPYTWIGLQPGTDYQVRIICAENNSIIYQTVNVTVADNYVPITDADISISNVCTNFTAGGTFTINSVTGGNASYEYSVVKSNDPSFIDVIPSNYTTNNVTNVTEYGTYQIRVKDACGNYKTFTRTLSANLPPIEIYWRAKKVCNSNPLQSTGNMWFVSSGGTSFDNYLPQGVKMVIRDTNASGAILFNGLYTGAPFTYTQSPTHNYYITTTNSCGISTSYTHSLTNPINNPEFDSFDVVASTSGCGSSELMMISGNLANYTYWNYPVKVTVANGGGTVYTTSVNEEGNWSVNNLPLGVYTVKYLDACGDSLTKTVDNPQNGGAPSLSLDAVMNWRCGDILPLTESGHVQVQVIISGYIPDKSNAVVTITSGPSSVGVAGTYVDNKYWAWNNLLPGTYTVSYTSCGVSHTGSFTISPTDPFILDQSLSSTGTSFCTGGGSITSNKIYNGNHDAQVELLNSSGVVIQTNSTGDFNNISPGTYTTRMKIATWCSNQYDYYLPGSTVTLTNSSTGPKITSSIGVVCEDSSGNPLGTGSAYLDIAGVAPYVIEYRVAGSSAPYSVINTSLSSVQLTNLTANTNYEVVLKDACGGSFSTTVQIKTMGALNGSNTAQPCNDAPYTLIMPYYAGAVYEWSNPSGTVVSNTRTYTIPNYLASNNGTYICKITWSTCVTRFVNVTLDSTVCGGPINVCYKDATTSGTSLPTNHGITTLGRAGDNSNWPMLRNGAWTVLEAKTKGFVINRIPTTAAVNAIANPVEGMIVYDVEADCLKINTDGTTTGWKCFNIQTCP